MSSFLSKNPGGSILALALSHKGCSISINHKEKQFSKFLEGTQGVVLSTSLMQIIEDLSLSANIFLTDIETVAVTRGPSSFTGLRIVLSVVQGFALAHPFSLITPTTFDLLEYYGNHQGLERFLIFIDNRKGGGYARLVCSQSYSPPCQILSLEELPAFMQKENLRAVVTDMPEKVFPSETGRGVRVWTVEPESLSLLLIDCSIEKGNRGEPPLLTPFYGHNPQYTKKKNSGEKV